MANLEKLIDEIKKLTVLELSELVKALEKEFGVSAAAPVAVAAAPAAGAAAPAVEEKTEFNVVLKSFPAESKIKVIGVVREVTGLGLVESKTIVEGLGTIKEGATKELAKQIEEKFKAAGAAVEIK